MDIAALLSDLDRVGYAVRENVLSPSEVAHLRGALDPLFLGYVDGRHPRKVLTRRP